jgi:DNA-binding NarL/FixJ family response regulator
LTATGGDPRQPPHGGNPAPGAPARILVVEDHPLVRQGIRALLELEGLTVCGEADDCAGAATLLARTRPDLLLLDLSLGEGSALDLVRRLGGSLPVLIYSMHEDWLHVRQALLAGADAYVTKRESSGILLAAVHTLLAGGLYTSPRASRAMDDLDPDMDLAALERFSPQELTIFRLLGSGLGASTVAERLELSRKTVETYCGRMQIKMNLPGMRELRILALAFIRRAGA